MDCNGKPSERHFLWGAGALVLLLVLLVYSRALGFGFVNWDDPMLVLENERIQSLSPSTVIAIFAVRPGHTYQPVRELSHALDLAIWGDWGPGHHLLNVLLHATAAILLLLIARRLGYQRLAALAAALLFACHPVNVEAVAWVSSRKYGLLAVFGLAALLLHLCEHRKSAVASLALAVLSSPFGIVFPALILLVDATRRSIDARDYRVYLCLVPVLGLIALGLFGGEREALASGQPMGGIVTVLLTDLRLIADYALTLLWPVNLNASYPYVVQKGFGIRLLLGLAVLISWAVCARRDKRLALWGGWFFLALAPVANVIATSTLMADRYLYLAAIGPFLGLGAGLMRLPERMRVGVLAGVVLLLAASAHRRSLVWQDSMSLWTDSVSKAPQNPIALVSLGRALRERGDEAGAVARFEEAIAAQSSFPEAYLYVGNSHLRAGKIGEARPYIEKAVNLAPRMAEAWSSLGLCDLEEGRHAQAAKNLRQARDLAPSELTYRVNLALALLPVDPAAAGDELWQACQLQPIWQSAADTLRVKGAPAQALRFYEQLPTATIGHARCLRDLGRFAESATVCRQILQAEPGHAKAQALLESLPLESH